MFNQKRFKEKAALRKTLSLHQEGSNKHANDDKVTEGKFVALQYIRTILRDFLIK